MASAGWQLISLRDARDVLRLGPLVGDIVSAWVLSLGLLLRVDSILRVLVMMGHWQKQTELWVEPVHLGRRFRKTLY